MNAAPPFAVAVSGGADSMAALLLTAAWCRARKGPLPVALTVDHGLRPDAAKEAAQVAAWAKTHKLAHHTLRWVGVKPKTNLQSAARAARYRLIAEWCRANGVATVITGHTLDDQAETFLLRLARGSGLDGLSGMAPLAPFPIRGATDLKLARPSLKFSHRRLVATLNKAGQGWIEDPSNHADRFARTQMRAARTGLEAAGLTVERIADAAAHLRRARIAIDAMVDEVLRGVALDAWGFALLDPRRLRSAPREVALRAVAKLLAAVGGEEFPPRFDGLEAVLDWMLDEPKQKGRTIAGCRLARRPDGSILMAREETIVREEAELAPGETIVWDGRFRLRLVPGAGAGFTIRALGPDGLRQLDRLATLPPVEPRRIAAAAPGFWREGRLAAAPLAGFFAADTKRNSLAVEFLGLSLGQRPVKN